MRSALLALVSQPRRALLLPEFDRLLQVHCLLPVSSATRVRPPAAGALSAACQ
jgi:hypothetical protein